MRTCAHFRENDEGDVQGQRNRANQQFVQRMFLVVVFCCFILFLFFKLITCLQVKLPHPKQ